MESTPAATRRRHDEALLARCVARVLAGERPADVAQGEGIPYSTLMTRVAWRRRGQEPVTPATRRKKKKPRLAADGELPEPAEHELLAWMVQLQRARICVRRRDVLARANGVLQALGGAPELGAVWFTRFRERHAEVTGHGTNLVVEEQAAIEIEAAARERGDAVAPWASVLAVGGDDLQETEEGVGEETTRRDHGGGGSSSGDAAALAPAPALESALEPERLQEIDTRTPPEHAVALLQDCYSDKLSTEDLADAFDVALDPDKARLLLVLRPGELRDLWLRRQLEKNRGKAGSAVI